MKTTINFSKFFLSILFYLSVRLLCFGQDHMDVVNGNLIQFNDNGAWCWYQDERAVVDTVEGKLIIGSDASRSGYGGDSRNGDVEGYIYDLETGSLRRRKFRDTGCDDHNSPAFLVRPDGQYLTVYADHYDDYSRYRIFNGTNWEGEQLFDWSTIPGGTDFSTTYSNLFFLPAEGRVYNFVRCYARSPNMLVSTDQGDTWSYGGLLTEPDVSIGYVNGYFKYSGNGYDRVDFVCTEHHPRDYNTSIYHGYILNGQSFNSEGTLMDGDISDKSAPTPAEFTLVFAANTIVQDIVMTRCWTIDLQNYDDDTIATIFKARADNSEMDHRYFYARYDGSTWTSTYLCRAGWKLYSSEQDYVGLGALDPHNPNIIYISTPFDPRDDSELGVREIFKGESNDQGATWTWTPITQNSTRNNYRPIVPAWDGTNTALLWMRGTYNSAQNFDMTIVGLLDYPYKTFDVMNYVDATTVNTVLSDGSPFIPTGPGSGQGAIDNQWHERTGYGNGGSVFTSAETGGENAPQLKTLVKTSKVDSFNVWANFWANPEADWRIKTGLTEGNMQVFRHIACKQVDEGVHSTTLELIGANNTFLYQAYLGRVSASADSTFEVFIDDEAIQTGTASTLIGDVARTWYDGISYSTSLYVSVSTRQIEVEDTANSTASFRIHSNTGWNLSCSESWLNLNTTTGSGSDTIIVTAEENPVAFVRTATITLSADHIESQYVDVYQKAANPSLVLSDESLTIGAPSSSTSSFSITSNTIWHVSSSQIWLTVDPVIGINDATVTLTVALNPDNSTREAIITVTATGLTDQSIAVTQDANIMLVVLPSELTIDAPEVSTATFDIVSNTSWSISIDESWLTANTLTGSNDATITLTAQENPDNSTREAMVTISADGAADQTIAVTQAANPIETISAGHYNEESVYPNPASGILYIELVEVPATIRMYTLENKRLITFEAENSLSEIDIKNLPEGIYVLQITTHDYTSVRKVIKN